MKKYDIFVPEWLHSMVKGQLLSPHLDWHFPGYGGTDTDLQKANFAKKPFDISGDVDWRGTDSLIYALESWLHANRDWFELEFVSRCLINFYAPGQTTGWHTDMDEPGFFSLLYYVNDSDGGTEFENGDIVNHKENLAIFFDSQVRHTPIINTYPRRINVNWILKGRLI